MQNNNSTVSKYTALVIATIGSFLFPMVGASINIALKNIAKDFEMNAVLLGWVQTSFLLSAAVFLVPFGRLADIYGRKKIFTIGVIVSTTACLFSALATTTTQLIISRVFHGVGSAMLFGTAVAILTSVFPPQERGRALGINVASVYLGLSLGPSVGGFLIQQLGWRSIFYINVPPGIIMLILTFWKLKGEWAEARGEKFDITGSLIYCITVVALMYGFSSVTDGMGAIILISGLIGFYFFIRYELKISYPVLKVQLFKNNRSFAFSNLAALINYSATFAVTFLLSLYLQYIKALSPQNAGLILMVQPLIMSILSPIAGRLSDKVEPRIISSVGMVFTAVGLSFLVILGNETSLTYIMGCLVILGIGFGLFSSPNTNAVMSSVSNKFYGIASGTLGTMRLTGQMMSMSIATLIFSIYIGKVQITPVQYPLFLQSVKISFSIFAVLCFFGIYASLARGKVRE